MRQPVSSPRNLESLITRIYHHEILTPKSCDEMIRILRAQRCNDMLPRFYPRRRRLGRSEDLDCE